MSAEILAEPGFVRLGPAQPDTPVVLAVPHAGRSYPKSLLKAARMPLAQLELLEDRYADALVDMAVAAGVPAIVATRARAWIDLNRGEREIHPAAIDPAPAPGATEPSSRSESGLGLVPTRLPGGGAILARPIAAAELAARIAGDHRPYHGAIAAALAQAHARHGVAVLIDCHSMPPLPAGKGQQATIVLGDRFGRSAGAEILAAIVVEAQRSGLRVARNTPYAGAHTLERHGNPTAASTRSSWKSIAASISTRGCAGPARASASWAGSCCARRRAWRRRRSPRSAALSQPNKKPPRAACARGGQVQGGTRHEDAPCRHVKGETRPGTIRR